MLGLASLAKRATVALETDHIEIRESQLSMISRILHLVMIDILAVGVAIRRAVPAADVADADVLNAILWRAAKGNVRMPAPKHTVFPAEKHRDADDD